MPTIVKGIKNKLENIGKKQIIKVNQQILKKIGIFNRRPDTVEERITKLEDGSEKLFKMQNRDSKRWRI